MACERHLAANVAYAHVDAAVPRPDGVIDADVWIKSHFDRWRLPSRVEISIGFFV